MALESGDHIWYYDGQGNEDAIPGEQTSTATMFPRLDWFPQAHGGEFDYSGNGPHIFNFVLYDTEIRRGQPQLTAAPGSFAWLNNNPGNLTRDGNDYGQFAGKVNWHNFLIFPDHDTGFAAIGSFLTNNGYLDLSIAAAFQRYAPKGDGKNSPDKYATDVAAAAGVAPGTALRALSDDQMQLMLNGIQHVEGWIEGSAFAYNDPGLPQTIADLISEV